MGLSKIKLGSYLIRHDIRNTQNKIKKVMGISVRKEFREPTSKVNKEELKGYKLVYPKQFAAVPTTHNEKCFAFAYNDSSDVIAVSSINTVFSVDESVINPYWLVLYFSRPEFDRYARFNSWGSARETFNWEDLCDVEIELPDLPTQQKYVDIYKAMVANQQSYERGLEDLKLSVDAELDRIKKISSLKSIGSLLQEIDNRNESGKITNVQGINITKQFMPSVADTNGVDLSNYKLVKKGQFAYSGMQTGRDECIRIALYMNDEPIIISPAYSVFETKDTSVLSEYIMMWFSRSESDRRGWFMSDSSIRTNLDLERFYEIMIPVPDIKVQKAIVEVYAAYTMRKQIIEQLKTQIKSICPILIKGSLEDCKR